jgi:enamine deaminase RidA (YjgF/YER057c/UK114 family)
MYCLENVSIPEYHISLSPNNCSFFEDQLDDLLQQLQVAVQQNSLSSEQLVFAKIFLSDYINQKPLLDKHKGLSNILSRCASSTIEQAPLDGTKINLLLFFLKTDNLRIERQNNVFHIYVNNQLHVYQSISEFRSQTPYRQTEEAFQDHSDWLEKRQLTLKGHCVRTWIYSRDVDKDYAEIVKARNNVFDRQGLTHDTHYIASTGIEGKGLYTSSCVNIDFYSIPNIRPAQIHHLQALDYLNPTHEYGVAFERGTSITYPDKKHIFISGTASIDKQGNCVHRDNVLKQTERLFLNIGKLLDDGESSLDDIAQMIVYLRNVPDYPTVRNYLDHHFENTPKVVVLARVCRPEWLIEVECLAVKRR